MRGAPHAAPQRRCRSAAHGADKSSLLKPLFGFFQSLDVIPHDMVVPTDQSGAETKGPAPRSRTQRSPAPRVSDTQKGSKTFCLFSCVSLLGSYYSLPPTRSPMEPMEAWGN